LGKKTSSKVIFKGSTLQFQWFNSRFCVDYSDWWIIQSKKGWTSNEIALKWLRNVFIPPDNEGQTRLLILDGHGSYTTDEFMTKVYLSVHYNTGYRAPSLWEVLVQWYSLD